MCGCIEPKSEKADPGIYQTPRPPSQDAQREGHLRQWHGGTHRHAILSDHPVAAPWGRQVMGFKLLPQGFSSAWSPCLIGSLWTCLLDLRPEQLCALSSSAPWASCSAGSPLIWPLAATLLCLHLFSAVALSASSGNPVAAVTFPEPSCHYRETVVKLQCDLRVMEMSNWGS